MGKKRVKVNTKPVAGTYAAGNERIVEFSSPNGGGLISFTVRDNGRLDVSLYRLDSTVDVRTSYDDQRGGFAIPATAMDSAEDPELAGEDDDDEHDDEHDDNDECGKYVGGYRMVSPDGTEVSVDDLEVGDLYRDPATDGEGEWFEVDDIAELDGEVHIDSHRVEDADDADLEKPLEAL